MFADSQKHRHVVVICGYMYKDNVGLLLFLLFLFFFFCFCFVLLLLLTW